ncbi:hypothetical protein [Kitasatospora sp. NPDC088134]|uniref:hypothetical protein n=1 Tax=Kitasatospora sp. NPDC088134 TaxID=3364071 RepID=UPI003816F5A2
MTITDMPSPAAPPVPATTVPAPARANTTGARTAPRTTAVHTITRQEYDAARTAVDRLTRLGKMITNSLMSIGGGALVFTCANVTLFAMSHDIPGWIAWMLDPMASLALITVLYVDGVLAEQGGERAGTWPFLLRWFAGISTWLMNSWTSLYPGGRFTLIPEYPDAGGLLLHSVAPFLLITMAEASSGYRTYLAKRLAELRRIIQAFEDQQHAEKSERERRSREAAERAEAERRETEKAEREDRRLREEREHEQQLENERMRQAAEVARIASQTETERLREQRELENARAAREDRRLREEREAEIERLREQRELENAKAKREAERLRIERENEDARLRREQEIEAEKLRIARENEEARQRSEAESEALRIKAEADAQARILMANEQVRQQQEAERERRAKEAAEAADKHRKAQERAAARQQRLASQTARTSRTATSRSVSEIASNSGGTVPREVRSQLREQAEREVARLILEGSEIDQQAIGERYGKGETWVGDRIRSARKRLANDTEFENAVIVSAFEDEMPVSEETKDDDRATEAV